MSTRAIITALRDFRDDEGGMTTVEYAIACGLISTSLILAFKTLGLTIAAAMTAVNAALEAGGLG